MQTVLKQCRAGAGVITMPSSRMARMPAPIRKVSLLDHGLLKNCTGHTGHGKKSNFLIATFIQSLLLREVLIFQHLKTLPHLSLGPQTKW